MQALPQFAIGDFVILPKCGVGRIEAIEERTIGGETKHYYRFKHSKNATMWLPCDGVTFQSIGDADAAKKARQILGWTGNIAAVREACTVAQLKAMESEFFAGCSLPEAAEILRAVFFTKGRTGNWKVTQLLRHAARDRVVGEIAAIEGRTVGEVEGEINVILRRQ